MSGETGRVESAADIRRARDGLEEKQRRSLKGLRVDCGKIRAGPRDRDRFTYAGHAQLVSNSAGRRVDANGTARAPMRAFARLYLMVPGGVDRMTRCAGARRGLSRRTRAFADIAAANADGKTLNRKRRERRAEREH